MKCQTIEELITPYVMGDIDAAERELVKAHLAECEGCQALARDVESTLGLLRDAMATDKPQVDELDAVRREKIREAREPAKIIRFPWHKLATYAAVFAICSFLFIAFFMPTIGGRLAKSDAMRVASMERQKEFDETFSHSQNLSEPLSSPALRDPEAIDANEMAELEESLDGDYLIASAEFRDLGAAEPALRGAEGSDEGVEQVKGQQLARLDAPDSSVGADRSDIVLPATKTELARDVSTMDQLREKSEDLEPVVAEYAAVDKVRPHQELYAGFKNNAETTFEDDSERVRGDVLSKRSEKERGRIPAVPRTQAPSKQLAQGQSIAFGGGGFDVAKKDVQKVDLFYRPEPNGYQGQSGASQSRKGARERSLSLEGLLNGKLGDRRSQDDEVMSFAEATGHGGKAKKKAPGRYALESELQPPAPFEDAAMLASKPEDKKVLAEEPVSKSNFQAHGVNPFIDAQANQLSTFSIDVDTASYTLARKYIEQGQLPPAEAVRTEEFLNYFDYNYEAPRHKTFAVHAEVAPSPFGPGLQLLQVGVKAKRVGREEQRPSQLTFVVDTSGSMNTPDRLGLVKRSLGMLVDQLDEKDQVSIVQYDTKGRLVLDRAPASQKDQILATIDSLQTSGSTHLSDGIELGYEVAAKNFQGGAMNQVLILSDGVANLGGDKAEDILKNVEAYREKGITCSVYGFGMGNYDDSMLETLANKGDGIYQFIDSDTEARRAFVDELASSLNIVAEDAKIQVEFNPERVKQFRQIGYENRQLAAKDFRNDAIDAGEVGSGKSVTALYEVELHGDASEPIGNVRVRYRNATSGAVEEFDQHITAEQVVERFEDASARFKLAASVAEFAEVLRGSPFAEGSRIQDAADSLRPATMELNLDQRVQELQRLMDRAPGLPRANE